MDYCTLTQVRAYLGLKYGETGDDEKLLSFIRGASQFIDRRCGRRFDVRREIRLLDYPLSAPSPFGQYAIESWVNQMNAAGLLGQGVLYMDDDLLSVETLVNGDGATIDAAEYVLEPANVSVHHAIRLLTSTGVRWKPGSEGRREQVISVTGLWGYHDRYSEAWVDTLDTVQSNPLTSGSTSLFVVNPAGPAADLQSPRFQAGQVLQIDDEWLSVTEVNANSRTLTVKRAVQGSSAAAHAQGTPISVYRPSENVVMAALRLTAWRYRQKDANVFDTTTILGTGVAILPTAVPADVLALLPAPKPTRLV